MILLETDRGAASPASGSGPLTNEHGARRHGAVNVSVGHPDHTEREAKLSAPAAYRPPNLDGIVDDLVAVPRPERELRATYYDTRDRRLARAGITVRYRTGDDEGQGGGRWTVKLPAPDGHETGHLSRQEISFEGDGDTVPDAVANLVRARARSAPLEPVAMLVTRRRTVELVDSEGQPRVEIDDDEVSVVDNNHETERFRELEVELAHGAPVELLARVVDALRAAGARPAEPVPKVVRALGPAALAPPEMSVPALDKHSSIVTVVVAAVAAGFTRLVEHDPGVRLGTDPEDVHQARVATRRLRSDLRTVRPVLDEQPVSHLRDELKWLGRELGKVRDADVLLERLHADIASLDDADATGGKLLVRLLEGERETSRNEVLQALASERYVALLDGLAAFAAAPPLADDADRPARRVLPRLVARPWRRLERIVATLPESPSDEALHQVRIRAKRVRYAAELAAPVVGGPAPRFARALAALQDDLGEVHDAAVAEQWLRAASAHVPAPGPFVAGLLVANARERRAEARQQWHSLWRAARSKRLVHWLD